MEAISILSAVPIGKTLSVLRLFESDKVVLLNGSYLKLIRVLASVKSFNKDEA